MDLANAIVRGASISHSPDNIGLFVKSSNDVSVSLDSLEGLYGAPFNFSQLVKDYRINNRNLIIVELPGM